MSKQHSATMNPVDRTWMTASGELPVPFTNDFLFCKMLQTNNLVLKSLICSLMHLSSDQVDSITITNPIELGEHIEEKSIVLDVKLILNDHTIIDLEMQLINEHNWPERSLLYLCRTYSQQMKKGDDYQNAKAAIQIGILDFILFPDHPEFFANYYLMNPQNHHIFSDKIRICVLSLNQIELATEEDKAYHIDKWARLFKCKDWREVQMLANNNPEIKEAAATIYELTEDDKVREMCERREKALFIERSRENLIKQQQEEISQLSSELTQLSSENTQLSSENSQLSSDNAQLSTELNHLRKLLAEYNISTND